MDKKFYVSYEAARLLKEKGYNEKVDYMYDDGELALIKTLTNEQIDRYYRTMYDGIEFYGAPTKSEAIDWLESKGIVVEVLRDYRGIWYFYIYNGKNLPYLSSSIYRTRLEAEEAAIIKALNLVYVETKT